MKKVHLTILIFVALAASSNAQVAISTDGSLPDQSAILDLNSKDKGLLLPRVPEPNSYIHSPTQGLMVYNATEKNISYYNGAKWNGLANNTDIKPDASLNNLFPNSKGFFAPLNLNNIDYTEYRWLVPAGITKIWVEAWAGGQAGNKIKNSYPQNDQISAGGASGSFASIIISVIPNETITIKVGKGGYLDEDLITNPTSNNLAGNTIVETLEGNYLIPKTNIFENAVDLPNSLIVNGLINYVSGEVGQNSYFLPGTTIMKAGKGADAYPSGNGGIGVDESFIRYSDGINVSFIKQASFFMRAQNGKMPGGGGGAGVIFGRGGPGMVILHW